LKNIKEKYGQKTLPVEVFCFPSGSRLLKLNMTNTTISIFSVDNDESIRRLFSLFLSDHYYIVETYACSEEYLEREV
jgi:hypothetical protein